MPSVRYFDDLLIRKDSPLVKALGVTHGSYSGKFNLQTGEFFLRKRGSDKSYSMTITADQLLVILLMLQRDKFTPEELRIIERIKRSASFSGSKAFPAHHIIPIDVCKNSKLVVAAIRLRGFNPNGDLNRLPLPAYFHNSGAHDRYSYFVADILEKEWSDIVTRGEEEDGDAIQFILEGAISYFRDEIQRKRSLGTTSINDVFSRWD
jgi:hypothetical protein